VAEEDPKQRSPGLVIRKRVSPRKEDDNDASEGEDASSNMTMISEAEIPAGVTPGLMIIRHAPAATAASENPPEKDIPGESLITAEQSAVSSEQKLAPEEASFDTVVNSESTEKGDHNSLSTEGNVSKSLPDQGAISDSAQAAAATAKPRKEGPQISQVVYMIDKANLMERLPSRRAPAAKPAAASDANRPRPRAVRPQMEEGRTAIPSIDLGYIPDIDVRELERRRPTFEEAPRENEDERRPKSQRRQQANKIEVYDMRDRAVITSRLRKKKTRKGMTKTVVIQPKESKRVVKMDEKITVSDLAHQLGIKASVIIKQLIGLDLMVGKNDYIDLDTAQIVAN